MAKFFGNFEDRHLFAVYSHPTIPAFAVRMLTQNYRDRLTIESIRNLYLQQDICCTKFRRQLFSYICAGYSKSSQISSERGEFLKKIFLGEEVYRDNLLLILFDMAKIDTFCAVKLFLNKAIWHDFIRFFLVDNSDIDKHPFHEAYSNFFVLVEQLNLSDDYFNENKLFNQQNMDALMTLMREHADVRTVINSVINMTRSVTENEFLQTRQAALDSINSVKPFVLQYYFFKIIASLTNSSTAQQRVVQYEALNAFKAIIQKNFKVFVKPQVDQPIVMPRKGAILSPLSIPGREFEDGTLQIARTTTPSTRSPQVENGESNLVDDPTLSSSSDISPREGGLPADSKEGSYYSKWFSEYKLNTSSNKEEEITIQKDEKTYSP